MSKDFTLSWNPPKHNLEGCEYDWQADYAALNHNGSFEDEARRPSRPWVYRTVYGRFDARKRLEELLKIQNFDSALRALAKELEDSFTETIESPIFYYDTVTFRQNGTVVSSPRDVVDMGNLKNSLVTRIF